MFKRFDRVKVNLQTEGIVQNSCGDGESQRITISVPGVKGRYWIVVPNEYLTKE